MHVILTILPGVLFKSNIYLRIHNVFYTSRDRRKEGVSTILCNDILSILKGSDDGL
jgi:hypothetical protein